jgi:MHS family proline/betaine transporter-like MFS transporter
VFGGSTQLIIAWLIKAMDDPLVPAWYQIGANLLSILAILLIATNRKHAPAVEAEAPG